MEEKLDFSLPKAKKEGSAAIKISIILLLILVGLTSAVLYVSLSREGDGAMSVTAHSLSAEQAKELASKLAQRNLYDRAADVWQVYLSVGELTDAQRARTLFQIGTLLEKGGSYEQAIEYYYRSEIAADVDELEPQINAHIKDCFERLGRFSALRYELMDRVSLNKSDLAGAKIVAEIGSEKVTEADLDAAIENDIENQLSPWAAFMTNEQLNEQKKRMLEQYKSPQAKQQYLQTWLAQEVLYREALQQQLAEKSEVKKLLNEQTRGILSQQLMNQQLAARINVTETDLQTYYAANKSSYVEPAKATISHILVDDQQQANDLLGRIKDGQDFAELAKQFTKDKDTKEKAGRIDTEVSKGSLVPGIGEAPELNEKIFAVDAPAVLDEPYKTEKGWEIIKVEDKQDKRQKGFDEVREQVMSTLLSKKRQDVQQEYIKQMMDKYNVIFHVSAVTGTKQSESEKESVK